MIRRSITTILILTAVSLTCGCQKAYVNADLQGTWESQDHTLNSRGKTLTNKKLVLTVDEDSMVTGESGWVAVQGEGGHDGSRPAKKATENILGAFDPETGTFYLVETEENGFIHGKMIDHDEIKVFLVQTGVKPVVSSTRMSRVDK